MPLTTSRSLCLVTLFLIASSASARHIHHRAAHQHSKRATPVVVVDSASPVREDISASITAGNNAIEDIQDIQEGLSDLPGNLLKFIQAVEARLEEVEGMLASMMSPSVASATPSRAPPVPFPTALPDTNASSTSMDSSALESLTSDALLFHSVFSTTLATSSSTSSSLPDVFVPTGGAAPAIIRTLTVVPQPGTEVVTSTVSISSIGI